MKIANKFMLVLGAVSMASVATLPAVAGDAYANGSSTIVLMNGASQSVAAEVGLPGGTYFTGANTTGDITVTPALTAGTALDTNTTSFADLNVNPGVPDTVTNLSSTASASFTAAAAAALDAATLASNLSAQVSIIRAGAGVDGLE
jgi:hypothetical protein